MTITFSARTIPGWGVYSVMTPFTFPAGEAHIKGADTPQSKIKYQIADIRGYDAQDFMHLAMWADACRTRGDETVLYLPYLPGARADKGTPFGASVYASLINGLGIDSIITIDPHSSIMPSRLDGLTTIPVARVIRKSLGEDHGYVGVIAPDKGAIHRAEQAALALHVPLYRAEKTRDQETGQLSGFHLVGDPLPEKGRLLIVDDICDGGGTFIGLAEELGLDNTRLDLWVTHGVFSKGTAQLGKKFGVIHTTDSYATKTDMPAWVKVYDLLPWLSLEEDLRRGSDKA